MPTSMALTSNPAEIKSVSSTSNHDEEDILSDSSAEAKKVRPVLTKPKPASSSTAEARRPFVADLNEPSEAPSPAPVPIRGRDDEFIRVSHVRKIKVNSMGVVEPKKKLDMEDSKRTAPSKGSERRRNHVESDDDDGNTTDCDPMDVIEKSPYEPEQNAEYGVEIFTKLRSVLQEVSDANDYKSVNPEASKIFGPTNAWCLVKASALIEKSGMVFSQEWCNGNIRGNQLGKIPKDLLLLCIVSKRIARAQDLLLAGLTRDLEVCSIVHEALEAWNIKKAKYPKIFAATKSFQFQTKRRDCYKCVIFVARVYSCLKAFSITDALDPQMKAKVMTCIRMMEQHLPDPNSSRKRRKSADAPAIVAPAEVPSDPAVAPPKRKRGRPRKNPLSAPSKPPSIYTEYDDGSQDSLLNDEDNMVPYNPPVRNKSKKSTSGGSSSTAKKTTSKSVPSQSSSASKKSASLAQLVGKFEEQYAAMGTMYRQMGETMKELRSKIQEKRTATEEEIRNELLEEVQESLLRSFGKKL